MRYLSDGWLRQASEALEGLDPVDRALSVGVTVHEGPDGPRQYRLVLGPDRVTIDDDVAGANVSMSLTWPDAVAIAQGHGSAQRAFLDGRLRLGGDVSALLGDPAALASADQRLASLRERTEYH
jgi:hypothetical protein